ncbi:hypothetical protein GCM10010446_51160 [Streptomyces enissocaesilis]|uniref:Uncharacterized protein n=1 Tax=Streptomyces enissocaesilis TaxID=332589 RepID=A0ABN3XJ66_9ACTN
MTGYKLVAFGGTSASARPSPVRPGPSVTERDETAGRAGRVRARGRPERGRGRRVRPARGAVRPIDGDRIRSTPCRTGVAVRSYP